MKQYGRAKSTGELWVRFPATYRARVLSIYTVVHIYEARAESQLPQLEQNTASFAASATATSSTSMVGCAVSPCSPTLKLSGAFENKTIHEDID